MSLGLVMIVRDELERIDACLGSARAAGCETGVIVDTGSLDGTGSHIMAEHPWVNVAVEPWVNFGHNRSSALRRAYRTADWLLALDADMTVEWDEGWTPDPAVEAYMVRMGDAAFEWWLPLLLRGDVEWRSIGAVHEYTAKLDGSAYVAQRTEHVRVKYVDRANPGKTAWQAGMLEEEHRLDPGDARTMFYLAQCYRELGRTDEARDLYRTCAAVDTYEEEGWYAEYMAACLAPTFEDRLVALMLAWEKRPHRLEPVYVMARDLNSRSLHQAAWALVNSVSITPTPDNLFVHRSVWNWGIAFERSIAAYWVGQRDLCRELSLDLLTRPIPDDIRAAVIANLAHVT